MLRILPSLAVAQMLGIAFADAGWVGFGIAWSCAGGAIAWWCAERAPSRRGDARGRARRAWGAAVLLAFAAGAIAQTDRLQRARAHRPVAPIERTLEGTIDSLAVSAHGARVDLRDVAAVDAVAVPAPERVRLYTEPIPGPWPAFEHRHPGERVRVVVRLRAPAERHNPGLPSPGRNTERAGIGAVGRLLHPALHVRLPEREGLRLRAGLDARRAELRARLAVAGDDAGLLRALALGDRRAPSAALNAAFARLGISHLLAVSGLHLALVAGLGFAIARYALRQSATLAARRDTRALALCAAAVAALAYALLSGWGVPVRRAVILLGGLGLAFATDRRRAALPILAAAAIAVLAADPAALFQPGAQLSFLASLGLVAAARRAPRSSEPRGAVHRHAAAVLRTTASVVALTAPLVAFHFGRAAPFALAVNLFAVPWTAFVLLPAAGLALAAAVFAPGTPAEGVLQIAVRVSETTAAAVLWLDAQLPLVPAIGPPALWTAFVLAGLAVASLAAKSTRARVACALASTALLAYAPPRAFAPEPPRVVVFDVGQGDAILVQGRASAILIDAGAALRGGFDFGSRVVTPALAALGVRRLDLVIATHADLDHRGGLPAVLREIRVGEFWLPFGGSAAAGFAEALRAARENGVPIHEHGAGDPAVAFGDLRVEPLWPPKGSAAPAGSNNDRSLVVRVEVAGRSVLLPGDLEAAAESRLVARGSDLRADVLTLPHHGSRTSSSSGFLAAVSPVVAVASAPCQGRYRMPHPDVLARSRRHGFPVWWTGRDGAVMVGLAPRLHVAGSGVARSVGRDRCLAEGP